MQSTHARFVATALVCAVLGLAGCSGGDSPATAPTDATFEDSSNDATSDSLATEADVDVGADGTGDLGLDDGLDMGVDAAADVGSDVGEDGTADVGLDASPDQGVDADAADVSDAAPACTMAAECAVGQSCNTSTGRCEPACGDANHSPCNGGCCDTSSHQCASGTTSSACGASGGACAACSASATGSLCTAGVCGCRTASDCSATMSCNPNSSSCTRCGSFSALADDFPGADPGGIWTAHSLGGAIAAESGGELVVTLPSNSVTGSDASYESQRFYDLRGDAVWVDVTGATNTATSASAYFLVEDGQGNQLEIDQKHGTLRFAKNVGGTWTALATTPYVPTTHRYWRFREDGTNVYWETSSDATSWVARAQAATSGLFSIRYLRVALGGSTDGGEVNPGSAHFAHVNGGGTAVGRWCPIATLTDDFASTTRSAQWNRSFADGLETVSQSGGQLVFTLAANATAHAEYVSSASYDLTGSAVLAQVPATANTTTSAQTYVSLEGPGGNAIVMIEEKGQLTARADVAGSTNTVGSLLYDPTQHAWWRVRESGGTLFWETAPDGKVWTVQAQLSPLPFAIDTLDVHIGSGTWQSVPNPGASHFDNVDLPPP